MIEKPYVAETADAKEHGKNLVARTHPFRSSSGDVAQVLARSNVDLQYTPRVPVLGLTLPGDYASPAQTNRQTWFSALKFNTTSKLQKAVLNSVTCAFRAAHCADYYITKYSSKSLQTFSPLMTQLRLSLEKLQADEAKEAQEKRQSQQSNRRKNDSGGTTAAGEEANTPAPSQDGAERPLRPSSVQVQIKERAEFFSVCALRPIAPFGCRAQNCMLLSHLLLQGGKHIMKKQFSFLGSCTWPRR